MKPSLLNCLTVALVTLIGMGSAASSEAQTRWQAGWQDVGRPVGYADRTLHGRLIDMSVEDTGRGQALPVYPTAAGLSFVEGRPGSSYTVHLHNRTDGRVLVVLAVDGINAISGQTAGYGQAGYVLEPYAHVDVEGWRKSYERVARFVFTSPEASYAGRTGRGGQVGVIGAAVFQEVQRPVALAPPEEYRPYALDRQARDSAGAAAPAAPSAASAAGRSMETAKSSDGANMAPEARMRERNLGTGHGDSLWSQARVAQFERRSARPDEIVRLDYDDRGGLMRRGIRLLPDRWVSSEPEAFPGQFVPDPNENR